MQGFFIGASSKLLTLSKDERPVKTSLSPNQPKKSKTQIWNSTKKNDSSRKASLLPFIYIYEIKFYLVLKILRFNILF